MSERRAVTKTIAIRYMRADRAAKKIIMDELCATTGWHRDHARKALRGARVLNPVKPRRPRPPLYGEPVIEALRFLWAVQGTPCGRLLAAALPDLVPRLRRLKELDIDDATAGLLLKIAPATIDASSRPTGLGIANSKSPDLVQQEIWGHLCCHYAIRTLMADTAAHSGHDPDRVSFVAALRIARRSIAQGAFFPSGQ